MNTKYTPIKAKDFRKSKSSRLKRFYNLHKDKTEWTDGRIDELFLKVHPEATKYMRIYS